MTIDKFDIENSNAPTPTLFRVSDAQTYAVEFEAKNAKEFEINIKKLALSSIPKHAYIKEIQVLDFDGRWLNITNLVSKFGNGMLLDLKMLDYDDYYQRLIKKYKGSWALSHVSLISRKPDLSILTK